MLEIRSMRTINIYQLAQIKLTTECVQADQNLLRITGHTNLLSSLLIRLTDRDDKTRRFDEELTTLKKEEDRCDRDSKPILAISTRNTLWKRGMLLT